MLYSALSNWGATSHMCLFEFKLIKIKYDKKFSSSIAWNTCYSIATRGEEFLYWTARI